MSDATAAAAGEPPTCPVCGEGRWSLRYRLSRFRVLACEDCEQVYLWPRLDPDEIKQLFSSLYTEGEGSVPELKSYYDFTFEDRPENPLVQLYESWLDRVEARMAPGKVLDIGCGTGLFLAVARRRGWATQGVDECEEALEHARGHFQLDVSAGEFAGLAPGEQRFDLVTMWDVLEHARQPVALLAKAREVLRPEGRLALSTPRQDSVLDDLAGLAYRVSGGRITAPLEKFYIEQHFLYFTPRSLTATLARAGFGVEELRAELTDLRRLALATPMRLVLQTLFAAARLWGRENRMFVLARPHAGASVHKGASEAFSSG